MNRFKKEKANLFATKLGHKRFKESQGWLIDWKQSRNKVVLHKKVAKTLQLTNQYIPAG